MKPSKTLVGQLRGATQLAIHATRSVSDVVEAMHHTLGSGPELLGRPLESTTKRLTAPTYGAIRGVTGLVGHGLDQALAAFEPLITKAGAESSAPLAALNGVVGDYLAATHNPLAIEMRLLGGGAALELTPDALARTFVRGSRLLVLIHGSSLDEACWNRSGHDHGRALAADLDAVPIYLRYNSGLHISQNGRAFSSLLEQLVTAFPRPVEDLILVGHSMGGLLSRSACAIGEAEGQNWRRKLSSMAMLGTPHHGAPLERRGMWFHSALERNRFSAPLAHLGKLRSAGVTDLRYGNVLDADWEGYDRFAKVGDRRTVLPLPSDVRCFAVAATTAKQESARIRGDGLVPVSSALGQHRDSSRTLAFDETRQWIAYKTTHLGLLSSPQVFEKLRDWLAAAQPV